QRHDYLQAFLSLLNVLELSGPLDVIAGREFDALCNPLRCVPDVTVDVARCRIDQNEADKLSILVANAGRTSAVINVRVKRDRNLRDGRRWNLVTFQR